jgi:hypothetical protein
MLLFQINGELWSLIFLLIIFAPLGVLLLILKSKRDKARIKGLREIAKKMGLNFSPKGSQLLHNQLDRFNFPTRRKRLGSSFWITNLIEGNTGKIHISIFDVRRSGKHGRQNAYLLLRSKALVCPEFRIAPESLFHKLDHLNSFGWHDIDFNKYPEFSDRFLVTSSDEEHFRKFFNVEAIPFFLSHPHMRLEAQSNAFLFTLPALFLTADTVEKHIAEAIELYNLLIEPEQPSH